MSRALRVGRFWLPTLCLLLVFTGCVSRVERAKLLHRNGQLKQAEQLLELVLRESPRDLEARLELARQLQAIGELERSEDLLRMAVELVPDNLEVRLGLASVLEARQVFPLAVHQLDKARQLGGERVVSAERYVGLLERAAAQRYEQGDYAGAVTFYERLVTGAEAPDPVLRGRLEASHVRLAERLGASDRPEAALEAWDRAIALNGHEPGYHLARGQLLAGANRPAAAQESLARYIEAFGPGAGERADAAERVAQWYLGRDAPATAAAYLAEAARLQPRDTRVQLALGEVRLKLKDEAAAQSAFRSYLDARGGTTAALRVVAERCRSLGARGLAEAYFRQAFQLEPGRFEVARALAELLISRGARDEARVVMKKFSKAAQDEARAAFKVGSWASKHEDSALAIDAYERAARLSPSRTLTFLRLADVYRGLGRHREADKALGRFVAASGDKASANATVADRLREGRRYDDAARHLKRAIAGRKDDPSLRRALARVYREAVQPGREERALEAYVQRAADRAGALLEVGKGYRRRSDLERAARFLARAARGSGTLRQRQDALMVLGDVYQKMGDLARMKQADQQQLELAPDDIARSRVYGRLATRYRRARLMDQYLAALSAQARLDPGRARLQLRLGDLHLQRGDGESAAAAFRRFVASSKDKVEALHRVAQKYQSRADYDRALSTYLRVREVAPGDPRYLRYTADLYRKKNDRDRAAALYDQLLDHAGLADVNVTSLARQLYKGAYYAQAARAFQHLRSIGGKTPSYAFELGECFLRLGDEQGAKKAFREHLERRGDDPGLRLKIARLYRDAGRLPEALQHYRKALEGRDRVLREAYAEAAELLIRTGDKPGLREISRSYLEADHNELRAREKIAHGFGKAGMRKEAVAEWRRVLGLRPNHDKALRELADQLYAMGRAKEAATYFARLIEEAGGQPDNWLAAAGALKARGAYEAALDFYARALAKGASPKAVHMDRGSMLLALGRVEEAKIELGRLLAFQGVQRKTLTAIGTLYERYGQLQEAIQTWRHGISVDPPHGHYHRRLVALYLRTGQLQLARRSYLAARAGAPSALFHIAREFQKLGFVDFAAEVYEQVLEGPADQHHKEAFARLARYHLVSGRPEALQPAVQRFVVTSRSAALAHRLVAEAYAGAGHFEQALHHAQASAREKPDEKAFERLSRYALLAGRKEEALQAHLRQVELAAAAEEVAVQILLDFNGRGERALAQRFVERLVEQRLSPVTSGLGLARLRLAEGNVPSAFQALDLFVDGAADRAGALESAAELLTERGFRAEAADFLETAAADPSGRPGAWLALAQVRFEQGERAGALEAVERYLELKQPSVAHDSFLEAGATLRGGGAWREAAVLLRKGLRHPEEGKAGLAFRLLLLALLEGSELAELKAAIDEFIEAGDSTRERYDQTATILFRLLLLDEAEAVIRAGLTRFPADGDLVDLQVAVQVRRGNDEALDAAVGMFLDAAGQARDKRVAALANWFEKGLRYDRAAKLHLEMADRFPGDRGSLLRAARAQLLDYDPGAEATINRYLAAPGERAEAERTAAALYLAAGETERAGHHCAKAVAADPQEPRAYFQQLVVALLHGDKEVATGALKRYLDKAPEGPRARLFAARRLLFAGEAPFLGLPERPSKQRLDQIGKLLAAASEEGSNVRGEARVWQAIVEVLAGSGGRGAGLAGVLAAGPLFFVPDPLEQRPAQGRPLLVSLAADAQLAAGLIPAAEASIERWLQVSEDPQATLQDVFEMCRRRGARKLLLSWLDQLDRRYPDNPWKVTYLAEALEALGDVDAAIRAYQDALTRSPRAGVYANNLAYLYSRHRRQLPEALELVRWAERLQPASSKYYLDTEGWILHRMGRHQEARECILSSIRLMDAGMGHTVSESFYHLGVVAEALGDLLEARRAFRRAAMVDRYGEYGRKSRAALKRLGPLPIEGATKDQ